MDVRKLRCLLNIFKTGIHTCVADVVTQGVVKQHGVLRNNAYNSAQALLGDRANVLTVNHNASRIDVIKPEQ